MFLYWHLPFPFYRNHIGFIIEEFLEVKPLLWTFYKLNLFIITEHLFKILQVSCMKKHQGTQYLVFLQIYIVGRQLSIKWCYCVVYFGKLNLQCESHNTNRYSTVKKKNRQYTWEYLDLKQILNLRLLQFEIWININ